MIAVLLALVVFGAVLAVTPPGARALYDLLLRPTDDTVTLRASYAVGAAAFLALLTLVLSATVLALAEILAPRLRRRGQR